MSHWAQVDGHGGLRSHPASIVHLVVVLGFLLLRWVLLEHALVLLGGRRRHLLLLLLLLL